MAGFKLEQGDEASRGDMATVRDVADRQSGVVNLGELWGQMRAGRLRMRKFFKDGSAHCAFLFPHSAPPDEQLQRALDVLESAFVVGQKVTALNLGMAISTTASLSALALNELGIEGTVTRVPLLVGLAIVAAHFSLNVPAEIQAWPGNTILRLSGADAGLTVLLPEAQSVVASKLLDGLSYEEIARERGVSQRTVANQIASIFRQLNVSSRAGLVWVVARAFARAPRHEAVQSALGLGSTQSSSQDLALQMAELRARVRDLEDELTAMKKRFRD